MTKIPKEVAISAATIRKDIKRFTIVMMVFTIGMAVLLFFDVSKWWIW
ncbi:MAG: hypothetical protein R2828_21330 [Saprospiraceae bacterium]